MQQQTAAASSSAAAAASAAPSVAMSSSGKPELRVGGRYRLGRKIGSGSFGDIYLGSVSRKTHDQMRCWNALCRTAYVAALLDAHMCVSACPRPLLVRTSTRARKWP
jgi:hypothetical protein